MHLTNVYGTLTIIDGTNTITINIIKDMVSIPTFVDDDITVRLPITLEEISQGQGIFIGRWYQLSIGKKFKTIFEVVKHEIKQLGERFRDINDNGGIDDWHLEGDGGNDLTEPNVLDMKITFKFSDDLQSVLTEK